MRRGVRMAAEESRFDMARSSASGLDASSGHGRIGPSTPGRAHQAGLVRVDDGLHPVAQSELHEHPADMGLHGGLADDQLRADLRVVEPLADELEDLLLARRSAAVDAASVARPRGDGRSPRSRRRVIDGASNASPAATTRTARTVSSRRTSLRRKPLAPARSASKTYSSRSKVVRMMHLHRIPHVGSGDAPGRLDPVAARACGRP